MKTLNYQQRIEALKGIENKIEQSAALDGIVSEMMKRHSEYIRMRTAANHLSALAKRWNGGEEADR